MSLVLAFVIGGLYAIGMYLLLRRNLAKLILGLALLTNAANLLIFTVGGLTRARPPLVPEGETQPRGTYADPLPQALILTAIVIGFGVLAFAMVLAYRAYQTVASDDLDDMKTTDYIMTDADPDLIETYDEEEQSEPEQSDAPEESAVPVGAAMSLTSGRGGRPSAGSAQPEQPAQAARGMASGATRAS